MRYSFPALQRWLGPQPTEDAFELAVERFRRAVGAERALAGDRLAPPGDPGHDPAAWARLQEAMDETSRAAAALREWSHDSRRAGL